MEDDIQERPAAGMAWAVRCETHEPVYIGRLDAERHVGLRCQCICPACGALLQAVNLQEPPSSRRLRFFRHHVGTQGPGCKYRVAELAALKLLAEQGVIEIPAPRRRAELAGLSRTIYQAEAVGEAVRERIVERRLVSETAAVLTLESGRKVALVLRGHQDVGELGSVFAVVEVHVDDPEVAWLSPEEIISRSELESKWLHVIEHEQAAQLQAQAEESARQRALDQLDIDTAELDLPAGATRKQASESLIHWAVKEALMQTSWIQAPKLQLTASAAGRGGMVHSVPVVLQETRLWVQAVAAEVLFEGYRADIVCLVREDGYPAGSEFKLLIEVAVTNKVKPEKLRLIQAAGTACVELDVLGFSRGGSVTRSQLQDLVARDLESKAWLHHPRAAEMLRNAQQRANAARDADDRRREAAELREKQERRLRAEKEREDREREQAKAAWARGISRASAIKELLQALKKRWSGQEEGTSNGMFWAPGELETAIAIHLPRGLVESKALERGGLVWKLACIVRSGKHGRRPLDVQAVLGIGQVYGSYGQEEWLGLLHLAIDEVKALVESGREGYEEQRSRVLASLNAGERRYARPSHLDDVLTELFPELQSVLSREFGTRAYSERIRLEREAEKRRLEEELEVAEKAAIAARLKEAEEEAAEKERRRVPDAVEAVTYQWTWRPDMRLPKDAAEAVEYLKFSKHSQAGEPWVRLVSDGFGARQAGEDFAEWFRSRSYSSVDEVTQAREVLEAAWLVQSKMVATSVRLKR